jgi:thioredoxin 1
MKQVYRFTASWCAPCKALGQVLQSIDSQVPIEVVDIDEKPELAAQYQVRGVPTLVMVENGTELKRFSGMKPEGFVREWLEK